MLSQHLLSFEGQNNTKTCEHTDLKVPDEMGFWEVKFYAQSNKPGKDIEPDPQRGNNNWVVWLVDSLDERRAESDVE